MRHLIGTALLAGALTTTPSQVAAEGATVTHRVEDWTECKYVEIKPPPPPKGCTDCPPPPPRVEYRCDTVDGMWQDVITPSGRMISIYVGDVTVTWYETEGGDFLRETTMGGLIMEVYAHVDEEGEVEEVLRHANFEVCEEFADGHTFRTEIRDVIVDGVPKLVFHEPSDDYEGCP